VILKVDYDRTIEIYKAREYKVVKHNEIVQKTRFKLSVPEQKTVAYIASLIKPKENITDIQPLEYEFEIRDYCRICGIDYDNGKNYSDVKKTIKGLRDKSMWLTLPDGTETTVSWVSKVWCNKGSGKAKIRLDEDIAPYLLDVRENTTRYQLLNILPMKSKYSIRVYELMRSWCGVHSKMYGLEELRNLLMIPSNELVRYPDFRRYVLETAQKEINEFTDILVNFEPITKGRKTIAIRFYIKEKSDKGKNLSVFKAENKLGEIDETINNH